MGLCYSGEPRCIEWGWKVAQSFMMAGSSDATDQLLVRPTTTETSGEPNVRWAAVGFDSTLSRCAPRDGPRTFVKFFVRGTAINRCRIDTWSELFYDRFTKTKETRRGKYLVDDVRFSREEKKIQYRIRDFARSRIRLFDWWCFSASL